MVKMLASPLLLLLFLFPLPAIVYARVTLPLQLFKSWVAETVLSFPVLRGGNILGFRKSVFRWWRLAAAFDRCSRAFQSLVYAYLFDRRVWMRWLLLRAIVPPSRPTPAG